MYCGKSSINIRERTVEIKSAKSHLAYLLTASLQGFKFATASQNKFNMLFQKDICIDRKNIFSIFVNNTLKPTLLETLSKNNIVSSRAECKRLIKQGGLYMNGEVVTDISTTLPDSNNLVKIGKKIWINIICKK